MTPNVVLSSPIHAAAGGSSSCRGVADASTTTEAKDYPRIGGELENVLARSLRNENDLLRFQLTDIIARERNQRVELQRLRSHRDVEVSQLVNAATGQLKSEVDQLKCLLQTTSAQLLQALTEKEKIANSKEQSLRALDESKLIAASNERAMVNRISFLEESISRGVEVTAALSDSVDAFQRHVLPTFKPCTSDVAKSSKVAMEPGKGNSLMEELTRLEGGLSLLRVIVDAKNDTLVLIRGKLKQENEELRAELQVAREKDAKHSLTQPAITTSSDEVAFEKSMLRQELHSLQVVQFITC